MEIFWYTEELMNAKIAELAGERTEKNEAGFEGGSVPASYVDGFTYYIRRVAYDYSFMTAIRLADSYMAQQKNHLTDFQKRHIRDGFVDAARECSLIARALRSEGYAYYENELMAGEEPDSDGCPYDEYYSNGAEELINEARTWWTEGFDDARDAYEEDIAEEEDYHSDDFDKDGDGDF